MCVKKVFSLRKSWFLTHTLVHTGHIYVNTMKSRFMFIGVEWLNMLLCPPELCWSLHHQIEAICPLPSLLTCECREGRTCWSVTAHRRGGRRGANSPMWLLTLIVKAGVLRLRR